MISLNTVNSYFPSRYLTGQDEPNPAALPRVSARGAAAITSADVGQSAKREGPARERLDQAYRVYLRGQPADTDSPQAPTQPARNTPRQSSAALLHTMIHQMGGALNSSAKGTFIDIDV